MISMGEDVVRAEEEVGQASADGPARSRDLTGHGPADAGLSRQIECGCPS